MIDDDDSRDDDGITKVRDSADVSLCRKDGLRPKQFGIQRCRATIV
jgi:hypothetical protein